MIHRSRSRLALLASAALIPSVYAPLVEAQVYACNANGCGYVSTPNPTSPTCPAGQTWTYTAGHYACSGPPSQGGDSSGGTGGFTPRDGDGPGPGDGGDGGY
ncbi:hypothetical protein [Trinickia acidisoli]|uniref:hypothetical protein n=1 Tax=Trinickia acidisoli TaxID=2767482 RepID=UPI001A8CEEC6|nr:hypothetical protein [Trinickia acidisoli]